jgi:glutaredoxin-related protein
MVTLYLSKGEILLLDTIHHVEYGELYDVEIAGGNPIVKKSLRDGNAKFIEFARENGYVEFPTIVVHNKVVKQIEVAGKRNGTRYKKRIRF